MGVRILPSWWYVIQIQDTMDTQNDSQYPHGKTIIKKYSSWKMGQHKSSVLQSVPGYKTQFIGKIYFEKIGEDKNYVAKSSDDKEVFGVSKREYELEKWFAQEGHRLAVEKLEAEKARLQAQTVEPEQRPMEPQQKVPEQELDEIRSRQTGKGKGINR